MTGSILSGKLVRSCSWRLPQKRNKCSGGGIDRAFPYGYRVVVGQRDDSKKCPNYCESTQHVGILSGISIYSKCFAAFPDDRTKLSSIFSVMKEMIARGRYEVNGGVWVECDCNITGGESIIRQFLWGQRYTLQKFGILSDCFWLPDTFGYSAAIPQIMRGFGIKYFLTTKMAWNDTNRFPYNTFVWEGIDHSQVLAHLFVMDTWADPQGLLERVNGIQYEDGLINKQDCSERLVAFGYGDGGGGPTAEMIETARRTEDLKLPKTYYSSVSGFMKHIGETYLHLPRYKRALSGAASRDANNKQQIKRIIGKVKWRFII